MSRDALIVGINQYPNLKNSSTGKPQHLTTPASDAEAIAQLLETYGNFRVKRLPSSNLDGKLQVDPKKLIKAEELEEAIAELFLPESRKPPETALLFFAGHGLRKQLRKSLTQGFLATSDASPSKNFWGYSLRDLWDMLEQSQVKQQVIWLDCCFAGELLNFNDTELGRHNSGCDRAFIAASRDYEVAYQRLDGEHGILTGSLLKRLDPNQIVEFEWLTNHALVDSVFQDLQEYYRKTNIPQYPVAYNSGGVIQLIQGRAKYESKSKVKDTDNDAKERKNELLAHLAEQLRPWFDTLKYRFESECLKENYFEWIINPPIRRRGYNRILLHGIAGEGGVKDVSALHQSVDEQKTDEGWLVSLRRISQAARNEVKKTEKQHLCCFTLDELLDQNADFSKYFDWLEKQIKRQKIDTMYVSMSCIKEEFDHISKQKIGVSRYDEHNGWIDGYIDRWLDDPAKEHLSILGEFGTGKTWFALHYAWIALQRYRIAQNQGIKRPRLPIVIPLRDYAKAATVESLLSEFFFRKHETLLSGYSIFEQLNRMGKLLIIFDGFDEMAARVNRQEMINNFWELAKVVVPGAKVIFTCRTEHFPEAKEGRALLNAELRASTANLTGETPQFEVLELEKFNDQQIRQVLLSRTDNNTSTVEAVMRNPQLLDLVRRPVMTELVLDALPDIQAGKPVDIARVYLYAVRRKMERDIREERTFTSLADKLYFLCELSWEMLSTNKLSLNYRQFPERILSLFPVVQEQKDLDHWQYDMMGQTMLIRNADGDYTPAHRSFLEFFIAYKLAAELGVLDSEFIALARSSPPNSPKDLLPKNYTWSSYFKQEVNNKSETLTISPIKKFSQEPLEYLCTTIGQTLLTRAIFDLLVLMVERGENTANQLQSIVISTRGKTTEEVKYVGGNVATLLLRLNKAGLQGCNLRRAIILGCDFTNANLQNVDFTGANLENSVFNIGLGRILAVASSLDAKLAATGDDNGDVRLLKFTDGDHISTFKGHTNPVRTVTFNPSGDILASGSEDATVRLWNITTNSLHHTLQGHTRWVWSVVFSPNGKILASGSGDCTVRIWDVTSGEERGVLKKHIGPVRSIVFSPDGQTLASASEDKTIVLWDITTLQFTKIFKNDTDWVLSVAFSPNGKTLASGSGDSTVKLWDVETGECRKILQGHISPVRLIAFSPDGRTLVSGSEDQQIKLWNAETGENDYWQENVDWVWVKSIIFSSDGKTLISSSENQVLRTSSNVLKDQYSIWRESVNQVQAIAFSNNNNILASASEDQRIRLWNVEDCKCRRVLQGDIGRVLTLAFSPDGKTLASGSSDRTVRLWNYETGECRILEEHGSSVRSIAFSPDGKTLAGGSQDRVLLVWNVFTGKLVRTLMGHKKWIWSVAFSPDGKTLASGSGDCTIRLWDVQTGKYCQSLEKHSSPVRSIAFSPDSRTLGSGSEDQTIRLWDIQTGECIKTLREHTSWVRTIAFSPNGKTLASGSEDRTLRLWNVSTGQCETILQEHTKGIRSVTFSPNGRILASGSDDETIKLFWNIEIGKALDVKTLRIPRPYEGMNITDVIGLTKSQRATLKALGAIEIED
ncbi:hypothetical protein NUACC21_61970 [Scytonema sp. NUACC21]